LKALAGVDKSLPKENNDNDNPDNGNFSILTGAMTMYHNPEANKKDAFVQMIVSKLGTCLAIPEEAVINQDESGNDMYFISKGDCAVNIKEWNGKLHIAYNCLIQGQHFGEISLIYKC
tara:strand:+ start:599 stop:952 length:354 start_codon:yes stop_codon:yes gene_type:complete